MLSLAHAGVVCRDRETTEERWWREMYSLAVREGPATGVERVARSWDDTELAARLWTDVRAAVRKGNMACRVWGGIDACRMKCKLEEYRNANTTMEWGLAVTVEMNRKSWMEKD